MLRFGLDKMPYEVFTLKHNPEKTDPKYYNILLNHFGLNSENVKSHLGKSVAIFSDNDPYVPLDNQDEYKNVLGSKIIVEHGKGHFSGSTGTVQLPSALEAILELLADNPQQPAL